MEDTNNEDTNEAEVNAPYIPTEEEAAETLSSLTDEELTEALASLPPQQDYITVPDGGLVFRTTTGRPLMHLSPLEDGTQLDLYGAGLGPDVQIQARLHGSVMHFIKQGISVASVGTTNAGGSVVVNRTNGTEGAVVGAAGAGGVVYVKDANGLVLEGMPRPAPESEAVDPRLALMMQPRPGEPIH